jgi:hypothetical protein
MATPTEPEPDIAEQLRRRVTEWVTRLAPRLRDEMCVTELKITLSTPGGDDEGRLLLDYTVDETTISERGSGVVTGQRFDPIPAPRVEAVARPIAWPASEPNDHYALFDALLARRARNPLTSIQLHGNAEAAALRSWATERGFPVLSLESTVELTPPESAAFGWMIVVHLDPEGPPAGSDVHPTGDGVAF